MVKKQQSLADALKVFNLENLPTEVVQKVVQEHTEFEALEDNRTLEAESVIFYISNSDREKIFKKLTCKQCGRTFLSTYKNVAYCTNECRKNFLESKGMSWNPVGRTESERWGGTIPKVIGPTATEKLQGMTFQDEPETSPPVEDTTENDDFDFEAFLFGENT